MSDTSKPETAEYTERTADETAIIEQQFKGGGYSGQPYIAPPAPGHDVKGLWHYFPAHSRDGYSTHAIALHRMLLDEMKVTTSLVPHRMAALDIDQFPSDRAEMLTKWMADAVGLPEAMIVSLPPETGMYDMARALVSYAAGPECTKASDHVVKIVNSDRMTALWCVSPFTARAYLNAGADPKKVFVVRPPICDGVWRDMFTPVDRLMSAQTQESAFVFGTLGTWQERKGFKDLLRAYFKAFKRDQHVELHIRTSSMDRSLTIKKFEEKVIAEIAEIAAEFGDNDYPASKKQPRIKLLTGTALSEQEVITWLGSLDAFVNASYGEGLGIPQMWAMAQGVPIVTSDFGAVGEFPVQAGLSSAVDFVTHEPVRVPSSMRGHSAIWGEDSTWGGYSVDTLAMVMRLRFDRGRLRYPATATAVRDYFSYAACRPSLMAALKHVCRPETLTGWFGQ